MKNVPHIVLRKKARHKATRGGRQAGEPEADVEFAIGYAYAASDEAEHAVLEVTRARANAGDPAGAGSRPG